MIAAPNVVLTRESRSYGQPPTIHEAPGMLVVNTN